MDRWQLERQALEAGYHCIAGVDEVGRGPLAGPVVAAAVVLAARADLPGLRDSKKLSPAQRRRLLEAIYSQAVTVGIGIVDPVEIDRRNILQAARCAMAMAIDNLNPVPDHLLIDGNSPLDVAQSQSLIPGGDDLSYSIAAASVVAKEARDGLMRRYDQDYPEYGFGGHMGYPTARHREALRRFGVCPIHRRGFRGVREHLAAGHGS